MSEEKPSITNRIEALLYPAGKEPETAPAPEPVETPEPVAASAPETPAPEAAPEPADESQPVQLSTLSELAEHLGVEVGDLYNLRIPVSTGRGKEEVSLGEWKDAYQAAADYKRQAAELAEMRRDIEMQKQSYSSEAGQRLRQANALTEQAERMLTAEMGKVDWENLRVTDPAEYAARRQEYYERSAQIQATKSHVVQEAERLSQEARAEQAKRYADILSREAQALITAIPEWRDDEKGNQGRVEVREYLKSAGFEDSEIANVADHRAVVLARKAMLYDKLQKESKVAAKKLVAIGSKVLTPGSPKSKADAGSDKLNKLRANLKRSGRIQDAAALLSERWSNTRR